MSLPVAIDEALKRGASHVTIARLYGISVASVQKRADQIAYRARVARERIKARERQLIREVFGTYHEPGELEMRDANLASMARWCALPIRYGNDPRSYRDGSTRVNLRLSANGVRTMGGVADYSSREAA